MLTFRVTNLSKLHRDILKSQHLYIWYCLRLVELKKMSVSNLPVVISTGTAVCQDWITLLTAINNNDIDTVQMWLRTKDTSPNFVYDGQNPICQAATAGFEDIVDLLLQYKCDPLQPDLSDHMWFRQPIHMAASKGHLEVVRRLVRRGVDINSRDSDHRTPLHWVSTYGHLDLVEYLLSAGACVNIAQIDGFTPMHAATCLGHDDVCKLLIANGADVNRADKDGWTALHTAVCYGYENVVETLLDAGGSIHQTTNDDENCLHIAVSSGHIDIVKMIYKRGVRSGEKNINGFTAFHLAVYYNKQTIAQFLIEKNVDMCTENYAKQTPLYLAAVRGEEQLLQMMLDGGYEVSRENWLHYNTVPAAIKDTKIAETLLYMAQNPRTLREITCLFLRRYLGDNIDQLVHDLPLPSRLKELICFKAFDFEDG
ncbi:serine/threonine-protein phosphatase 6 regulatory ankyrin repeat subunit C-like [Haliotis asinina]|uniref:serine/threonine-protein phosphatase 6 regulatory ankyrin repeat subunit C-like n=1 Tax=Haliotis asinina TaxID=109174 RepID=UPI0035322EB8